MTPKEIIETCQQVDNLMCCIFSPTHAESYQELDRFAKLSHNAQAFISSFSIKFQNGSQIRFITLRGNEDSRRHLAGLEIDLAVMNGVYPSDYLRSRIRMYNCTAPISLGLPKIVELVV